MKKIALVYMVAGLASRFKGEIKSFVKVGPKNETLIEYSLDQAIPAGFTKIIFIVGKQTEKPFKEKFGNNYKGIPISYALQKYNPETRDKPWGTCDALCSAKELLNCPFVVCNGDDIYGKNSFKILVDKLKLNINATIGYKLGKVLPEQGETNRGIFYFNKETKSLNYIKEMFNLSKKNIKTKELTEETLASMTLFALQPEVLEMLNQALINFKEEHKKDRKIESLIPEEIGNLIKQNKITMKVFPAEDKWFGITNPGDEIEIQKILQQK